MKQINQNSQQSCYQIEDYINEPENQTDSARCIEGLVTIDWLWKSHYNGKLNVSCRNYQREKVAAIDFQQGIMHTVLSRDCYAKIPELHIRIVKKEDGTYSFELVDGQQRVTSVIDFMNNIFALCQSSDLIHLKGKSFKESCSLDKSVEERILNTVISCKWYENLSDRQVADLFINVLNNTNNMNWQEKRNAIQGFYTKWIQDCCRPGGKTATGDNIPIHPLFETHKVKSGNKVKKEVEELVYFKLKLGRLSRDSWLSQLCYMLEHNFGLMGCKEKQHFNWTEMKQGSTGDWSKNFSKKKEYLKIMDNALKIFKLCNSVEERKNKMSPMFAQMMVLYSARMMHDNNATTMNFELFVDKWFAVYEKWNGTTSTAPWKDRFHKNKKPMTVISDQFGGLNGDAITTIFTIFDEEVAKSSVYEWGIKKGITLDPVREFSDKIKEEVWKEQDKKCFYSGRPISLAEAIGDHYIPHTKGVEAGGTTTKDNCRVCTSYHNGQKNDTMGDDYVAQLLERKNAA